MDTCVARSLRVPAGGGRVTRRDDEILEQSVPEAFVCYNKSHLFFSIVKHMVSTSILHYLDVYIAMIDDDNDDDGDDDDNRVDDIVAVDQFVTQYFV